MKRLVLLLWLAGLFARPAQADPTVTVKASAGLGGWCRPGRWTPVRVDVETRGETSAEAAAGEIVVEWGDARVRRAMTLASPSHKQAELYIRTADARDSITVRVLVADREMARTVTPVRLVAPAEPLTVCVARVNTWPTSGTTCTATINPESLPRSWRGYAAADDVVWPPGSKLTLTAEQHTALDRWRVVQAIENAESTVPSAGDVAPATRALRRTSDRHADVRGRPRHSHLAVEPRSQPLARRLPGHRRSRRRRIHRRDRRGSLRTRRQDPRIAIGCRRTGRRDEGIERAGACGRGVPGVWPR